MFGKRLTELPPIKEAVVTYMMRASDELRAQGSVCKKIRVSIRTGMFNPEEAKFANGVVDLDKINGRWGRGTLRAASVPSNPYLG